MKVKSMETNIMSELSNHARRLRRELTEICISKGGHLSTSLSCVEIFVALFYSELMTFDPQNPKHPDRDRFILSKGHAETILYTVLCDLGFFPRDWIDSHYRSGDCRLGGHPNKAIPGVEVSTGALGHGLGLAAGMALAAKMDSKSRYHFVLMGDAECTEGSVWETAQFAAKHNLSNLVGIVDRNHIGASEFTDKYTGLFDLHSKWEAFCWNTLSCDGHDIQALVSAIKSARNPHLQKPTMIIAKTIKGKGISFMENDPMWHVKQLSTEAEIKRARFELAEVDDHESL